MAWSPLRIAQAAFEDARAARWVGVPKPSLRGRSRQLSPQERRNHLPSLARLLEQDAAPVHARRMSPREMETRER